MEQAWSETSSSPQGPLPQQELTWLLNRDDFNEHVGKDEVNLCCVMVTSTLCQHSGIGKLKYPKMKKTKEAGALSERDENEDNMNADEEEEEQDEEEGDDDGDGSVQRSRFFSEVKERLIETDESLSQRRNIRFFHVCACNEEETNIEPLIAKDPSFTLYGRKPSEFEVRELHRTAYKQLVDLVQMLGVTSTPCLFFFLKGQPLRYSLMIEPSPANRVNVVGERDQIKAVGCNYVKWKRILHNATVVRNEVMKDYDQALREKLRQERRERRRQERAAQRRLRAQQGDDEEGEEEDGDEY